MNLLALRNEVLNHGFDPNVFSSRVNQYLNDAQSLVARRVDYYIDEAAQAIATVSGTASYAEPGDLARVRSLDNTDLQTELEAVSLRDIDRSATTSGVPLYYALDGQNLHLYPTPDSVYNLQLRYWKQPAQLVNDTDTPTIPADWHRMLWYWAVKECYAAEDDSATSQYWEQQFTNTLAEFAADVKFPSTDYPMVAESMWNPTPSLNRRGWTVFPG